MSNQAYFALRSAPTPWGDYGRILMHGLSAHLPRENGIIQLERTGPFVPPVSFPGVGDVIVTQQVREMVEASELTSPTWNPVALRHVVELDWLSWDRTSARPPVMPAQSQPEAYVLAGEHAPYVAQTLPALWEIVVPQFGSGSQQRLGRGNYAITLTLTGAPTDFFRTNGLRHLFVSEHAASWIQAQFGDFVTVQPVNLMP